jgi:hypothetical protein
MSSKNEELVNIVLKFAESGWDILDEPSKKWLSANNKNELTKTVTNDLIEAVKQADKECGNCGCEYDPLYKSALELLKTA